MKDAIWTLYGFSPTDRDAWRVFLADGQAKQAARLRAAGFIPEDLAIEIQGWTVHKRLRGGESPRDVKRLLDQQRRASAS